MSYQNKRHYRVAQRDKEIMDENTMALTEKLDKIATFGLVMFIAGTVLSFLVGFLVGRHE